MTSSLSIQILAYIKLKIGRVELSQMNALDEKYQKDSVELFCQLLHKYLNE
jgi:hypothetical protein